jgi:hypothetical protein
VEHVTHQPLFQILPTPNLLAGVTKLTSSRLVYLQFMRMPASLSPELKVPCLLCYMSFSILCLLFSFFFFCGVEISQSRELSGLSQAWLWGYHVPFICSPVGLHLPSRLGAGVWQQGSPPDFSVYCGVGKLCVGWGFGGVRFLPLLGGFSCQVCLQHLNKIFPLWSSCYLLPPFHFIFFLLENEMELAEAS